MNDDTTLMINSNDFTEDRPQVGPGEGYMLTVGGFNSALSNLKDSMTAFHNGMKFSTK